MKIVWTEVGDYVIKDANVKMIGCGKQIFTYECEVADLTKFINEVFLRETENRITVEKIDE